MNWTIMATGDEFGMVEARWGEAGPPPEDRKMRPSEKARANNDLGSFYFYHTRRQSEFLSAAL